MSLKKVKLVDIAKEMNVSVGLVSLVLSGKAKESRISEGLSKKVALKAKQMGYQANALARGLRTGKSYIIGLIVADIANPYFGKMARQIENEASKLGYQVMFSSSDEDGVKQEELVSMFLSRQVDGMIIVPVANSEKLFSELQSQSVPFVFIDRYCEGINQDFVTTDNFEGAVELTNQLIEKGYKKIASLVYDIDNTNNIDRIKGYESALKNSNLYSKEPIVLSVNRNRKDNKLREIIQKAISDGCDAFFFANNSLGIESIKIISELGLKIPKDIAMVSFDNPVTFDVVSPGITCYEQPIEYMSSKAVNILYEKMKGNKLNEIQKILLPGNLIFRESI